MAAEPTSPIAPDGRRPTSRRDFIRTAAVAGASAMIVPRRVLGQGLTPPSDRLNIATVGIGGMGDANTRAVMSENIVAICDCDLQLVFNRVDQWQRAAYPSEPTSASGGGGGATSGRFERFGPSALQAEADERWSPVPPDTRLRRFVDDQLDRVRRYQDYRVMLEQQSDIDAVIVATPDHMHAPIAGAAMDLGKHVYVQKPLCWSVLESRYLARKAAETGVVTQMGNQGHSQDDARRGQEYLAAGAIGEVTDVHVWTNRPWAYWPQGIPRPEAFQPGAEFPGWSSPGVTRRLADAMSGGYRVPTTLDWDLFLGAAPVVPYHPVYHPFNWRGWVDWGQGALGDMGAHLIDHPVWALDLGLPTTIETVSSIFDGICYPTATTTHYEFAATDMRPALRMTWYDGGLLPPRPDELGDTPLKCSTSARAARCCRTPTAPIPGCCPPRATTSTARPPSRCRAFRTSRTR